MEESLLEELTGPQLVKKLPTFYGTLRFITAFTRAHHLSLSWALSAAQLSQSTFEKKDLCHRTAYL